LRAGVIVLARFTAEFSGLGGGEIGEVADAVNCAGARKTQVNDLAMGGGHFANHLFDLGKVDFAVQRDNSLHQFVGELRGVGGAEEAARILPCQLQKTAAFAGADRGGHRTAKSCLFHQRAGCFEPHKVE
jgi:hypothetical protein